MFKGSTPCIVPRVSGHPHSAQESTEMRSLHQSGRETKKFLVLSSSRLCLKGWGSSSLDILQVCSCAEPGSSQLRTPAAKRCCRGFLEVYRVRCLAFSRQWVGNHFYMAKWAFIYVSADKMVELVGWGSVINRAYPIKFFLGWRNFLAAHSSSRSLVVGWSVGWSVGLWCLW